MQGPDPPYSRVTQELKRSSAAVHKVCFTKQMLAPFHAAVIAPWFGCICREREATKEPCPRVLCIARPSRSAASRPPKEQPRQAHRLVLQMHAGSCGTAQPHKCLLEAGVKVCSLHCSQLGFWTRGADKYGGTAGHLGVVAKLCSKIQEICL